MKPAELSRLQRARRQRSAGASENLLLRGHQLLEFGVFPQHGELGFLEEFLPILEAFFEGLANVLNRAILDAGLGVRFGDVIVELGALLHGLILNRGSLGAAPLEYLRVDTQGLGVGRGSLGVLFASEVSRAQIRQERRGTRLKSQRLAILRNGPPEG